MLELLARKWVYKKPEEEQRGAWGTLCSVVGILLNLLLFAGKFLAGTLASSVAITADAFNNLSDAGSSLVSLVGFKLAGQKPDTEHPFGHGRFEYLAGLVVAAAILLMGYELGRSSIEKILHPEETLFSWLTAGILLASILVKLYMYLYNHRVGVKLDSVTLKATASDSLSDCGATAMVLAATLVAKFTGLKIDGWCGLLVALLILKAGLGVVKDTLGPLLGQAPDPEFVKRISEVVAAHPEVQGMHDLVVHDYGPGRQMISLHAEVSGARNIYEIHDEIDCIERELQEKLGCPATIHMDPVETDNERVTELKQQVKALVTSIDADWTLHDFRVVSGPTHTNVIFDLVVPFDCKCSPEEAAEQVKAAVRELPGEIFAVITAERPYV